MSLSKQGSRKTSPLRLAMGKETTAVANKEAESLRSNRLRVRVDRDAKVISYGDSYYIEVYQAAPAERVRLIKQGVLARHAKEIIGTLAIAQGETLQALNLSAATVNRKASRDQLLSSEESERVLGVARLIGQVQSLVAESGSTDGFDAATWLSGWLRTALPALGGMRPVELLDTIEGQSLVSATLARVQSGAYA